MLLPEKKIDEVLNALTNETIEFLFDLIRIPSTRGKEGPVNRLIYEKIKGYCDKAELMQIPESFKNDPEYSWPLADLTYQDTQNLRLHIKGSSSSDCKSLLINAHTDVVPPSKGQIDPFKPKLMDNKIYGRGACDDKGQLAGFYLLIKTLYILNLKPRGDFFIDLVIEEENGGNGTLFMVRNPVHTDAAIVMEPTEMKICAATRGAVWFEVTCRGRSGHSGSSQKPVSALKLAIKAMAAIENYHDELLNSSRGKNKLFDEFYDPMPVTFGTIEAGDWPATVPAMAVFKGLLGFLPNSTIQEVQKGLISALRDSDDTWLSENFEIKFDMLNNDGCEIPVDHLLVKNLQLARQDAGKKAIVSALTAACDSWRYNNQLNIPTVVIGAGSLWNYAHSNHEQIRVEEIMDCTKTLLFFIDRWCGLEEKQ